MLRVASFNIRNGRAFDGRNSWPVRRKTTLAAIRGLDADLIGLQEAFGFQVRWLKARLVDFRFVGQGRDAGRRGEHSEVLVRLGSITVQHARTRWFGAEPDRPGSRLPGARFPRIATTATVEADARRFEFTCTHLDAKRRDLRVQSATQLVDWLDWSLPQVVVGDFNAEADDSIFSPLYEAGLRQALPADAGGSDHGFGTYTSPRRIDHILVSEHFEVVGAEVQAGTMIKPPFPSDHWPVVADLSFRPSS